MSNGLLQAVTSDGAETTLGQRRVASPHTSLYVLCLFPGSAAVQWPRR